MSVSFGRHFFISFFDLTFARLFLTSFLDLTVECHFLTSLLDINFGHHFCTRLFEDYPANCLLPSCLLEGNMTGSNWSLCTHSQNASTVYIFLIFCVFSLYLMHMFKFFLICSYILITIVFCFLLENLVLSLTNFANCIIKFGQICHKFYLYN